MSFAEHNESDILVSHANLTLLGFGVLSIFETMFEFDYFIYVQI